MNSGYSHPSRLDVDEAGEIQIGSQPFELADISIANALLLHFKGDWQAAIDCVRVTAELRHVFAGSLEADGIE